MGGRTFQAATLAKLGKHVGRDIPIRFMDDVGDFVIDGDYVILEIGHSGDAIEALVMTEENFYACLGKVMKRALPAMAGKLLS